jgi:siderophore synthetase component
MDKIVAALKNEKDGKDHLGEERDYLQSQAAEKQDDKLEETVRRVALLNMELALSNETFNKRSKELEQSLSTHQSDLKAAREHIDALDKLVLELKNEKASLEIERDSLQGEAVEKEETIARAALLDAALAP